MPYRLSFSCRLFMHAVRRIVQRHPAWALPLLSACWRAECCRFRFVREASRLLRAACAPSSSSPHFPLAPAPVTARIKSRTVGACARQANKALVPNTAQKYINVT
jgi:hypothetical protein